MRSAAVKLMPTIIGGIFFFFGLYFFFWKEEALLGLLLVSVIFEASSVLNIAKRGIQPFYLIEGFIIVRAVLNSLLGVAPQKAIPKNVWLVFFVVVSVVATVACPIIFAGTPVYAVKEGIDSPLRPPLEIGLNNAAEGGFLVIHVMALYAILLVRTSLRSLNKAFMVAFFFLLLFIFGQSLSNITHIPFPDSIIRNNPGYGLAGTDRMTFGLRSPGSFSEPSFCGAMVAFYFGCFLAQYFSGKGPLWRVLASMVAAALVLSSGALAAMALIWLGLCLQHFPFRFPWYLKVRPLVRIVLIASFVAVPVVLTLAASPVVRELALGLTVNKGETASFANRTNADLDALRMLLQTAGLGLGLGSTRGSSLIPTMLSNIGLMGVISFAMFYIGLLSAIAKEYRWYIWGALGMMLSMCIDISEITVPILWMSIMVAVQFVDKKAPKRKPSAYFAETGAAATT